MQLILKPKFTILQCCSRTSALQIYSLYLIHVFHLLNILGVGVFKPQVCLKKCFFFFSLKHTDKQLFISSKIEYQTVKCSFKRKDFFFKCNIFLFSGINNQHVFPAGAQFLLMSDSALVHHYMSAIVAVESMWIVGHLFPQRSNFSSPRINNCGYFIYGKLSTEHAYTSSAKNVSVCLT